LTRISIDTTVGMIFSNVIAYFIILATASTLHAHGITNIQTAGEAAEALRPIAGDLAFLLFALGIIGTGLLAIPVLAGSAAYAVAEALRWRASLECKPRQAPRFYAVLAAATIIGIALSFLGMNPIRALYWSAVINGLLAPPLILLVILLTNSPKVMGKRVNSPLLRYLGWATFGVMTAAAAGMLITS